MRFLGIAKPKATMGMLPPDALHQILEASLAGMEQLREERKVVEYYYSPIGYSIVVLDYETADEWVKDQSAVPILRHMDQEIYPLANGMRSLKGMIEGLKAIAK